MADDHHEGPVFPEAPPEPGWEDVMCEKMRSGRKSGRRHNIVVVAEGATDRAGQPITSEYVRRALTERMGEDARVTILGHVQRGGTPVAYDRVLGSRFGVEAITAAHEGDFGKMVALRGTEIVRVPLTEALAEPKLLDRSLFETAEVFFG